MNNKKKHLHQTGKGFKPNDNDTDHTLTNDKLSQACLDIQSSGEYFIYKF